MKSKPTIVLTATLLVTCASIGVSGATDQQHAVKSAVDKAIQPIMAKYEIPGMAVGITVGGKRYVLDYGVASTKTRKLVTDSTLFEIGSISKTFTATLAAWAQVNSQLSLSDKTSKYLPSLQGTKFGEVSLRCQNHGYRYDPLRGSEYGDDQPERGTPARDHGYTHRLL
jgi:beta-lactamase class C